MIERRKYGRLTVEGMDFQCRMIVASDARLVNISIGGCSIRGARKLEIGSSYELTFKEGDSAIALNGVVMWSTMADVHRDERGEFCPVYETGIRFANTLSPDGMALSNFLEECSAEHRGRLRLTGLRVKMKESSEAVVAGCDQCCEVLKLSLGGMLIESARPVELQKTFPMELVYPNKETLALRGKVVNCSMQEGKAPPAYEVGIGFLEMDEPSMIRLNELITSLSFND